MTGLLPVDFVDRILYAALHLTASLPHEASEQESLAQLVFDDIEWRNVDVHCEDVKEYRQEILVVNRKSGELQTELIPHTIKVAMRMIYGTGRLRPHPHKVRVLLKLLTVVEGAQNDKPKSAKKIAQFVAFHKIDMSEYEISDVSRFASFNEFFYRKLKAGMRPVPPDDRVAVSPADCRLNVVPSADADRKSVV